MIFYNSQFVVLTSCEISYDVDCICSKVICNMVLMFLSQSSIATIFMRSLIKFVIVECVILILWLVYQRDLASFVRLNLFCDKFACNLAFRNPVFRWESCKGSV